VVLGLGGRSKLGVEYYKNFALLAPSEGIGSIGDQHHLLLLSAEI